MRRAIPGALAAVALVVGACAQGGGAPVPRGALELTDESGTGRYQLWRVLAAPDVGSSLRIEGVGTDDSAPATIDFTTSALGDALVITVRSPEGTVDLELGQDGTQLGLAEAGGGPVLDEMLLDLEPRIEEVIQEAESTGTAASDGVSIEALGGPSINWRCAFFKVVALRGIAAAIGRVDTYCDVLSTPPEARPPCANRFTYGTNYAWRNYGADFGGITEWGHHGVASAPDAFVRDLRRMRAAGVHMVRWFMFPELMTDAIHLDASGVPVSIEPRLLDDVRAALRLAEEADVDLMLTLFSFTGFQATRTHEGVLKASLRPMVVDARKRQRLLDIVIAPIARTVEASPYRDRMKVWDIINEPEWAITEPSPYSANSFLYEYDLVTVSHLQMKAFIAETARVLRANGRAQLTVGGVGLQWSGGWADVALDFDSVHYYDWMQWLDLDQSDTPRSTGHTRRPVMMTEFPNAGRARTLAVPSRSARALAADLFAQGYVGALSWAYNDPGYPWTPALFTGLEPGIDCN